MFDRELRMGVIAVDALPRAKPNRSYHIWARRGPEETPVWAGTIPVGESDGGLFFFDLTDSAVEVIQAQNLSFFITEESTLTPDQSERTGRADRTLTRINPPPWRAFRANSPLDRSCLERQTGRDVTDRRQSVGPVPGGCRTAVRSGDWRPNSSAPHPARTPGVITEVSIPRFQSFAAAACPQNESARAERSRSTPD